MLDRYTHHDIIHVYRIGVSKRRLKIKQNYIGNGFKPFAAPKSEVKLEIIWQYKYANAVIGIRNITQFIVLPILTLKRSQSNWATGNACIREGGVW